MNLKRTYVETKNIWKKLYKQNYIMDQESQDVHKKN